MIYGARGGRIICTYFSTPEITQINQNLTLHLGGGAKMMALMWDPRKLDTNQETLLLNTVWPGYMSVIESYQCTQPASYNIVTLQNTVYQATIFNSSSTQ